MDRPITKTHIQWLQNLSAHLCDMHTIAAAFQISPDKFDVTIIAIKRALNTPGLVTQPLLCSSVPGQKGVNYLQRILPVAHLPELWVKSGFNHEQLNAILSAFENARQSLTERLDAKRIRKDEAISANESARKVALHRAKKRIR